MAISQIIRWRQGRALVSHRAGQKTRPAAAGDKSAAGSETPAPSTKVSVSRGDGGSPTYLERVKRGAKAKIETRLPGSRIGAATPASPLQRHVHETLQSLNSAPAPAVQPVAVAAQAPSTLADTGRDDVPAAVEANGGGSLLMSTTSQPGVAGTWEEGRYEREAMLQEAARTLGSKAEPLADAPPGKNGGSPAAD
jgi:hypothetical protein